jgi:NTE family protein
VLDADTYRLYGVGDFDRVNYCIIEELGKRVLAVNAVEKSWGPNYLRFYLKFLHRPHGRQLLQYVIGQTSSFASDFYQPLGSRQFLSSRPRGRVGAARRQPVG